MIYRAVGNRCAVNFDTLGLGIPVETICSILKQEGFESVEVDLVGAARACIGKSKYRRSARPSQAPDVMDCSSFIKWLYSLRGIWLPRRSIQQRAYGENISRDDLQAGDLVFTSGRIEYFYEDPSDGVGHVGIATGENSVVHAANSTAGIIESAVNDFTNEKNFRGVRRLIPQNTLVTTFFTPSAREVETSDDVRWIILQTLPRS